MIGFKDPDYCPGGRNETAERRAKARRAGYASGVARRRRSTVRRPPRARTGQQAIALAYKVRQVGVREFTDRYREMCEDRGIAYDVRGLNTALELYRCHLRHHRACGRQDFETTNDQISRALANNGRPRCRRTVQRQRKRLEWMGLIAYHHVRRSGHRRIPGQLDSLRVRALCPARRANVTPPSGAGAWLRQAAPACTSTPKATALSPPPTAAETDTPASPANSAATRTVEQQRIWWLTLRAEHGFISDAHRQELADLLERSGQGTDCTASIAWEGER